MRLSFIQFLTFSLITLLLFFLVFFVWFQKDFFIGTGEAGIPFYNPSFLVSSVSHTWANPAFGNATSTAIISLPTFLAIFKLNHILSAVLLQRILFFFLLWFPFLTFVVFYKNLSFFVRLCAGLFYLFNLAAMVFVWNRLQYPYMFFYAFVPFGFWLFINGIEKKKLYISIIINLFIVIFSMMQIPPLLEIFWLLLFSYVCYYTIIFWKQRKKVVFAWTFFLITVIIWLIFNIWWILQLAMLLRGPSYITSSAYNSSNDLLTLQSISSSLGNLSYIFRLMNKDFFFNIGSVWGDWYTNPVFILLSYTIPFITFNSILLRVKEKTYYFYLLLILITVFFAKGVSDPFGQIFAFGFTHMRFLEVFRNPVEKLGLLLPFLYAVPFGFGVQGIYQYIKLMGSVRFAKGAIIFFAITIFGILPFPMWNGWLFSGGVSPNNDLHIRDYVTVPSYYKDANDWLLKDHVSTRAIALPMSGEGITYTWENGYSGVEISNGLFNIPFVSLDTSIQFLHPIVSQLEYVLLRSPENFTNLMTVLGSKYLMVRSDVNYTMRRMMNPKIISTSLSDGVPHILHQKTFDKLDFYTNETYIPKVFSSKDIYAVSEQLSYSDIFELTNWSSRDIMLDLVSGSRNKSSVLRSAKTTLIGSDAIINSSDVPTVSLNDAISQIPYTRFLPGDTFYPLIGFKEKFLPNDSYISSEPLFANLFLSTKRLGELKTILMKNRSSMFPTAIKNYVESLNNLEKLLNYTTHDELMSNNNDFQYNIIAEEVILNNLLQNAQTDFVKKNLRFASNTLSEVEITANMKSQYVSQISTGDSSSEITYKFTVEDPGSYEILLKSEDLNDFYFPLGNKITFQLNDTLITTDIHELNGWISFGNFQMVHGVNEVHISTPVAKNILEPQSGKPTQIMTTNRSLSQVISFNHFDPYATYKISLDYWIEKEGQVNMQIMSDIDEIKNRKRIPIWTQTLESGGYDHGWKHKNYIYSPSHESTTGDLSINVYPYNDCNMNNPASLFVKSRCDTDDNFYASYNKPSSFWYNNLTVTRVFTNAMILKKENESYKTNFLPTIQFTQINPSQYNVSVKNATSPFFLTFLENFHPLWKVSYVDTGKSISEHDHFLANHYANSWYIKRIGSYQLKITFVLEDAFNLGKLISSVAISISLLVLIFIMIFKKFVI